MYTYKITKLPKLTTQIDITITKDLIKSEYDKALEFLTADLKIEGFRKGKVPRQIAVKYLKKEEIFQQAVKTLFPRIYNEILKKENLTSVISPKIEIIESKEGFDWKVKITIAQKPKIILGDYKKIVKKVKIAEKKTDIWIPGKAAGKDKESSEAKKSNQNLLNKILDELLKTSEFEMSDLIIEEELNRRLVALVEDVQKLGLTIDIYLKSKNLTEEELKRRYTNEIIQTYKLEFILSEIADRENITVQAEDLDRLFAKITDEKERKAAKENSYFYASLLRKQKTLDYLLSI